MWIFYLPQSSPVPIVLHLPHFTQLYGLTGPMGTKRALTLYPEDMCNPLSDFDSLRICFFIGTAYQAWSQKCWKVAVLVSCKSSFVLTFLLYSLLMAKNPSPIFPSKRLDESSLATVSFPVIWVKESEEMAHLGTRTLGEVVIRGAPISWREIVSFWMVPAQGFFSYKWKTIKIKLV